MSRAASATDFDHIQEWRALSVRQPYAGWIARGEKSNEHRSWTIAYRGPLLICSARTLAHEVDGRYEPPRWCSRPEEWPRGVALCVVTLVDIKEIRDRVRGGSFVWKLREQLPIKPFPVIGKLSIFRVKAQLTALA